eukprot:324786-Chlamydomonas_euryale.AAC.3
MRQNACTYEAGRWRKQHTCPRSQHAGHTRMPTSAACRSHRADHQGGSPGQNYTTPVIDKHMSNAEE